MQFTKVALSLFALAVVSVSAAPADDGWGCPIPGEESWCNTLCGQEGGGKSGHCSQYVSVGFEYIAFGAGIDLLGTVRP